MQAKHEERRRAREMRATGASLNAIAERLGVAKSSASVWVRDVALPSRATRPEGAGPARRLAVWRSGAVRRCARCRLLLPAESFNRLRDGRQAYCRTCFRAYHADRGALDRAAGAMARRVARAQAHVLEVLRRSPCEDCGERDPVVLEFDHVRGKEQHVTTLAARGATTARLDCEIARCEIVCVNCHRRRTGRRAGWTRARPDWRAALTAFAPCVARNVTYAYEHLERSGCVDCGERDLVVLDFDHEGMKRFTILRGAWSGLGVAVLEREIGACAVRCASCHRRQTARRGQQHRWRATAGAVGSTTGR